MAHIFSDNYGQYRCLYAIGITVTKYAQFAMQNKSGYAGTLELLAGLL